MPEEEEEEEGSGRGGGRGKWKGEILLLYPFFRKFNCFFGNFNFVSVQFILTVDTWNQHIPCENESPPVAVS